MIAGANNALSADGIAEMQIRWRLAEQYLLGLAGNPEDGKLALHAVISHDFPMLLNELRRLDPNVFQRSNRFPSIPLGVM
jgi:hypothetical protein